MRVLTGTHETPDGRFVADWFGQVVGKPQTGPYATMGWQKPDGSLSAAVLFHDYTGANIEIHMVGNVRRHALAQAFRYAFDQLRVQRVTAKPYRSNHALRKFVKKLGFVQEGVMQRYYGPTTQDDAFVFRLDRDAAEKWMV